MDSNDKILSDAITATGRKQIIIGVVIIGIMLPIILLFLKIAFQSDESAKMLLLVFDAFMLIYVLAGIIRIMKGMQLLGGRDTTLYRLISESQQRIVSIHKKINTTLIFYVIIPVFSKKSSSVIIKFDNGKKVVLNPGNDERANKLIAYLKSKSPNTKVSIKSEISIHSA